MINIVFAIPRTYMYTYIYRERERGERNKIGSIVTTSTTAAPPSKHVLSQSDAFKVS